MPKKLRPAGDLVAFKCHTGKGQMPKKLRPAVDLMSFKCRTGKGQMPKKLRPAVDLMAFKCRTLKVNVLEPSGPLQACNGTALPLCHYYSARFEAATATLLKF
jgi:hypothetical protein